MHARAPHHAAAAHEGGADRRRLTWRRDRVDGVRLWARWGGGTAAAGSPIPVVLVHGLGVSGTYLVPLARRLAAHHAVWVPDLPGHGRSDHAPRPLDVPALAATLRDWMDAVGLARALLVGQSLGCQVIAELAARHPARAAGLLLVAPTPDPATRTLRQVALHLLADVPHERASLVPIVAADYLRAGPRVIRAEYRAMEEHRMREALDDVRRGAVPCAVVRGEHDAVVGPVWTSEVARLCGAPAPVTVRGVGHAVQHSTPGAVLTVSRALCERVPGERVARR